MKTAIYQALDVAWIAFGVYWAVMWLRVKRVVRRQRFPGRILHIVLGGLTVMLLAGPAFDFGVLAARLLPRTIASGTAGLAITIIGLAFTIWARFTLGTNWSSSVTIKQDHQLICSGPYRFVRHPIYSGLLLAIIGTAVALGEVRCFIAIAVAIIAVLYKSRSEEKLMLEEFAQQYEEYRRQTGALVPFVR